MPVENGTRPGPQVAFPSIDGAPPPIVIPVPPPSFVPVPARDYLGFHPKAGQMAQVSAVVQELRKSPTYESTFGASAPPAQELSRHLANALAWTALRKQAESLVEFLRSYEVVSWKQAQTGLRQLDAVYQLLAKTQPARLAVFPEIGKMLEVTKQVGQRAHASRLRNAKAKAATAGEPSNEAPTEPRVDSTR